MANVDWDMFPKIRALAKQWKDHRGGYATRNLQRGQIGQELSAPPNCVAVTIMAYSLVN